MIKVLPNERRAIWNLWVNKMQFIFQCQQLDSTLLPIYCNWSVTFHFSVTVYPTYG